jgi:NAD(P)-dependent dehydrogenase (short-subunit alcohol dehydrogenase family)
MDISGTALVTGASRGIGRAVAIELARRGFDVVATMRNPDDGADLPAQAPGRLTVWRMDVTDPATVVVPDDLKVLVNNAGVDVDHVPLEHSDPEAWRQMFETNVMGTVHTCRAAIPVLRANAPGVICNVTSSSLLAPVPFYAGYRGTKAAVSALCDSLRVEMALFGVRVVEVLPGPVDTDMFQVTKGLGPAAQYPLYRAMAEAAEEGRRMSADPLVVPPAEAAVAIADAILDDDGPMRYSCDPLGTGLVDMWRQHDDETLYSMIGGPMAAAAHRVE